MVCIAFLYPILFSCASACISHHLPCNPLAFAIHLAAHSRQPHADRRLSFPTTHYAYRGLISARGCLEFSGPARNIDFDALHRRRSSCLSQHPSARPVPSLLPESGRGRMPAQPVRRVTASRRIAIAVGPHRCCPIRTCARRGGRKWRGSCRPAGGGRDDQLHQDLRCRVLSRIRDTRGS